MFRDGDTLRYAVTESKPRVMVAMGFDELITHNVSYHRRSSGAKPPRFVFRLFSRGILNPYKSALQVFLCIQRSSIPEISDGTGLVDFRT